MVQWLFANQGLATTTLASNSGTTTPPSGTAETWFFNSLAAWPVAVAGVSQFAIADTNIFAKQEIIWVTNVVGANAAVLRGQEGSPVVAHQPGATYEVIVTNAFLVSLGSALLNPMNTLGDMLYQGSSLVQRLAGSTSSRRKVLTQTGTGSLSAAPAWQEPATAWINAVDLGVDISGTAAADTILNNAFTNLNGGSAVFYFPAGSKVNLGGGAGWLLALGSQKVLIWCDPGVQFNYSGAGDGIRMYCTQAFPSSASGSGIIGEPFIDGTNAAAGAAGLHIGDIFRAKVFVKVQNFNAGAGLPAAGGSIGVHFDNTIAWTEECDGIITFEGCSNGVVFDVSDGPAGPFNKTSTGSYARPNLVLKSESTHNVTRNGVVLQNGAAPYDGEFAIRGNFPGGTTGTAGAVLTITGSGPTGHPNAGNFSKIYDCHFPIGVETTTSGNTVFPQTINFGAAGNQIRDCWGGMAFENFGGGAPQFASSNVQSVGAVFRFDGPIIGDPTLVRTIFTGTRVLGAITTGGTIASGPGSTVSVNPAGAVTGIIVGNGAEDGQLLFIKNLSAFSVTFAAAGTSNVAAGASASVAALTSRLLVWDSTAGLWY